MISGGAPPIVRNSKMTSFSELAGRWGRIARAIEKSDARADARVEVTKQCKGTGRDHW